MNQRHCKDKGNFGSFQEMCMIFVGVVATTEGFCDRVGE